MPPGSMCTSWFLAVLCFLRRVNACKMFSAVIRSREMCKEKEGYRDNVAEAVLLSA